MTAAPATSRAELPGAAGTRPPRRGRSGGCRPGWPPRGIERQWRARPSGRRRSPGVGAGPGLWECKTLATWHSQAVGCASSVRQEERHGAIAGAASAGGHPAPAARPAACRPPTGTVSGLADGASASGADPIPRSGAGARAAGRPARPGSVARGGPTRPGGPAPAPLLLADRIHAPHSVRPTRGLAAGVSGSAGEACPRSPSVGAGASRGRLPRRCPRRSPASRARPCGREVGAGPPRSSAPRRRARPASPSPRSSQNWPSAAARRSPRCPVGWMVVRVIARLPRAAARRLRGAPPRDTSRPRPEARRCCPSLPIWGETRMDRERESRAEKEPRP